MAYDIFSRKTTTTSWAREGGESNVIVGSWARDKALEMLKSKIPWKTVAIVAGIAAGLFILPKVVRKLKHGAEAKKTRREFSEWGDEETTLDVRRPSMEELFRKKRRAA
jgi:hypothetical protein